MTKLGWVAVFYPQDLTVGQNWGMDILELYIPLDILALIAEIFFTTSSLWVCRRPGREPTILNC